MKHNYIDVYNVWMHHTRDIESVIDVAYKSVVVTFTFISVLLFHNFR